MKKCRLGFKQKLCCTCTWLSNHLGVFLSRNTDEQWDCTSCQSKPWKKLWMGVRCAWVKMEMITELHSEQMYVWSMKTCYRPIWKYVFCSLIWISRWLNMHYVCFINSSCRQEWEILWGMRCQCNISSKSSMPVGGDRGLDINTFWKLPSFQVSTVFFFIPLSPKLLWSKAKRFHESWSRNSISATQLVNINLFCTVCSFDHWSVEQLGNKACLCIFFHLGLYDK